MASICGGLPSVEKGIKEIITMIPVEKSIAKTAERQFDDQPLIITP